MIFRGTFEHSLDAKHRLTVPAKFRDALAGGAVLAASPETAPQARELARFFAANAIDTELDSAGRVMVPAFLLEHGGLSREVVVTGAGESLEIWDRRRWGEYNADLGSRITDIAASLDTST